MTEKYYCPRCREKTLVRKKEKTALGEEEEFLVCEKCGLSLWIGVLDLKTTCITLEIVRKLPHHLRHRVLELLRRGRLVFAKKFDIIDGVEHMCLESRRIDDDEALEVFRSIEVFLSPGWSRLCNK